MIDLIYRSDAIDKLEHIGWFHVDEEGKLVPGANSREGDVPFVRYGDVRTMLQELPAAVTVRDARDDKKLLAFIAAADAYAGPGMGRVLLRFLMAYQKLNELGREMALQFIEDMAGGFSRYRKE